MEPFVYFSLRKLGEFESDLSLDPKLVHHFAVSAGWGRVVSTGSIALDPVRTSALSKLTHGNNIN